MVLTTGYWKYENLQNSTIFKRKNLESKKRTFILQDSKTQTLFYILKYADINFTTLFYLLIKLCS